MSGVLLRVDSYKRDSNDGTRIKPCYPAWTPLGARAGQLAAEQPEAALGLGNMNDYVTRGVFVRPTCTAGCEIACELMRVGRICPTIAEHRAEVRAMQCAV